MCGLILDLNILMKERWIKDNEIRLDINGVRKSEDGARSTSYKSCFTEGNEYDTYRHLFYWKEEDKREFEQEYNVVHSKCYTEYGLKRTGCAGCPFGRDYEFELQVIEQFEPRLLHAVRSIFGDSYSYTELYKKFRKECEERDS